MNAKIFEFPSIVGAVTSHTQCRCPRHELEALIARTRARAESADALLMPASDLVAVLDDITATAQRLLPPSQKATTQ